MIWYRDDCLLRDWRSVYYSQFFTNQPIFGCCLTRGGKQAVPIMRPSIAVSGLNSLNMNINRVIDFSFNYRRVPESYPHKPLHEYECDDVSAVSYTSVVISISLILIFFNSYVSNSGRSRPKRIETNHKRLGTRIEAHHVCDSPVIEGRGLNQGPASTENQRVLSQSKPTARSYD